MKILRILATIFSGPMLLIGVAGGTRLQAETIKVTTGATAVWDWVPNYAATPPPRASHSICRLCAVYYYSSFV